MKTKSKMIKPRVRVLFNTGTRIILSKKDKAKSRRSQKSQLMKIVGLLPA